MHQKIDINAILSNIATPEKPRKNAYILASLNYYCISFIVVAIIQKLLLWINTVCKFVFITGYRKIYKVMTDNIMGYFRGVQQCAPTIGRFTLYKLHTIMSSLS